MKYGTWLERLITNYDSTIEKNKQMFFMEKRALNRIPVNIDIRFFHGNLFYSGVLRNLSDRGMFIETEKCLPTDSMLSVIIREDNYLLTLIVKVKGRSSNSDSSLGMGAKLISPSSRYLDFVSKLQASPSKGLS